MNRITTSLFLSATALTGLIAFGQAREPSTCAVEVSLTLHSYTGPIIIEDACLESHVYGNGTLVVVARDMGDGIFRDGFDGDSP